MIKTNHNSLNRHLIPLALLAFGATSSFAAPEEDLGSVAEQTATRPNIVFIMVDDVGYANLGCYGSTSIQTPNIDAMSKQGMRFTDCYSGASVCGPARSTLMTGQHFGNTPVRSNTGGVPLFPEDVTVAGILQQAGYITGGFGKWGLGNSGTQGAAEKHGFDVFFGYYNQVHAHDYYTKHLFRNSERVELEGPSHWAILNGDRVERTGRYSHYEIFEENLKFIKESAASGKPFFCYAPWTPPHSDLVIPEDDPAWALYKDMPWHGRAKVLAAMISMVDRHVGELLDLLKELGIDDNTIVFFTSDNGASRHWPGVLNSSGELRGIKGGRYEGSLRVPMVVRWPGKIEAGSESDLQWYFPDVMPTFAALAGATQHVPENIDGISIVPTLLGQGEQKQHEFLYWNRAIRMGKWKGIGDPGNLQLYNLETDIGEENDIAAQHPEVIAKLSALMEAAWTPPRSQEDGGWVREAHRDTDD
jgi:arylsulfatase A-like enzyme